MWLLRPPKRQHETWRSDWPYASPPAFSLHVAIWGLPSPARLVNGHARWERDLWDLRAPPGPLFFSPCSCVISATACTCCARTTPLGFSLRLGRPITGDWGSSWDSIGWRGWVRTGREPSPSGNLGLQWAGFFS